MTLQEIAQEIDKLKPDFKPFWEEFNRENKNYYSKYTFIPTGNHALDLFKIELVNIYFTIHPKQYMGQVFRKSIEDLLQTIPHNLPKVTYSSWGFERDIADKSNDYHNLISSHVTDLKQYLNPYLKKKFGLVGSTTKSIKQLQDNEFSIELFKTSLGKRKIPSTEVSMYFKQFKNFSQPIRDKFMEIVFEHCKEPSKKLQVELEDSGVFNVLTTSGSKYISVSRRIARWHLNTSSLPIPDDLHNERDSDYTPFTCGVPRKPTPTKEEVSALVGTMLVVQNSDLPEKDYIVSCFKEHLSNPGYGTLYTDQVKALRNYATSITKLTKDI